MKRIFILTMMLSSLVFNSCDEINGLEKELQDEASIVLAENQKTELTISPRGETIDIKFNSTLAWKAEVNSSASYKNMIEFIPNKGDGGDVVCKVKILKNESGKTRTFTLIITSEDIKVEFKLTQKSLDKHSDKDQDDEDEDGEGEGEGEGEDPDATNVASILAKGVGTPMPENTYIDVYVISDRNLGNLTSKKNMYVQDATGGLMVRFTADHTFNRGDRLKIDVSQMALEEYQSTIQFNNVDAGSKVEFVSGNNDIPCRTVSMSDFLANKYSGQYVALENIQVTDADLSKTFVVNGSHTSINMEDADGNTFVVFSSSYASFGSETVPQGAGTLKGIAAINNSKIQIIFSQQSDWTGLTGPRHGEESGGSEDDDTGGETNDGGNTNGYLVNYEVPFADITLNAGEDYSSRVSETNGGSAYAYIYDTKTTNQRIVTHTFNNNGIHRNYTFLYDYEKRCPIWLAYHLNEGFCSSSGDRTESWSYDPAIPEISQPNLSSSYSLGGDPYNRGHMLASNPRTGITNANTQTFYYTNMTPQLGKTFNTGGGVWNNLENAEDSFIPSKGSRDTLYVVTGCLFDDNVTTTICRKDGLECAVPDDFYKCFMLCSFDSNGRMTAAKGIGYLMPHETPLNTEYSKFAMSIDKIEALAGFDFFCNVPKSLQDKAESNTTELF